MKISVTVEVSQEKDHYTFDLSDFGLNESEWNALPEEEKEEIIREEVYSLPDQPYWMIGAWSEND